MSIIPGQTPTTKIREVQRSLLHQHVLSSSVSSLRSDSHLHESMYWVLSIVYPRMLFWPCCNRENTPAKLP